jgi:hypothetical protein
MANAGVRGRPIAQFKWTKSADQILVSVKRFCHKAQQTSCGELYIHVTKDVYS